MQTHEDPPHGRLRATVANWRQGGDVSALLTPGASFMTYRKLRIALLAVVIGAICGLIELPLPAEDAYRAVRAELRSRPAPDDIVVIALDDATIAELGGKMPDRFQYAQMMRNVFAAGAERLVFDKAFADPESEAGDAEFAKVLAENKGRVWLGISPPIDNGLHQIGPLVPARQFLEDVQLASMLGDIGPFGLSVRLPTSTGTEGKQTRSISAVLAGHHGTGQFYYPDFTFDPQSIPTISFVDVLKGRLESNGLAGKQVVFGRTHLHSPDLHPLPFGGALPGVYFHVTGAHTLKNGVPHDLSWYPALLMVAMVILVQARIRRPLRAVTWSVVSILGVAPFILDRLAISFDIFPALIALSIGTVGLNRIANHTYRKSTNLVLPEAIKDTEAGSERDLYALKIDNLGDFAEAGAPQELGRLVDRIIACLEKSWPQGCKGQQVAFDKDTLIWFAPRLHRGELEENALGLVSLLKNAMDTSGRSEFIEATLGIDVNHSLTLEKRMQNAMQAAETASRRGLRLYIADAAFLDDRARRLTLLTELEHGIAQETIDLGYQPKIELATGQLIGAEALIRWQHPEMGYIDPQELVHMAEEHRRIDDLSVYVIDRALREAKFVLEKSPSFKLAVNLSAQTLGSEMILYHVARLLHRYQFPSRNLILEVTESSPLDDELVHEKIIALQKAGVSFSIDDFGTGHSSLEYLRTVPSSELKIDRRFVMLMGTSEASAALVKGTIEMAHSLGKVVVAEGVEDKATAERLRAMGCDIAQGFVYSPAVPIHEVLKMIKGDREAA